MSGQTVRLEGGPAHGQTIAIPRDRAELRVPVNMAPSSQMYCCPDHAPSHARYSHARYAEAVYIPCPTYPDRIFRFDSKRSQPIPREPREDPRIEGIGGVEVSILGRRGVIQNPDDTTHMSLLLDAIHRAENKYIAQYGEVPETITTQTVWRRR